MDFTPHSEEDVRGMLAAVGAASVDELFGEVPAALRFDGRLDLPAGVSEAELMTELETLAGRSSPATQLVSFLGAGVYDHYVPAVVDAVVSRGEFLTAYTPYQPERSQGVLQSIFEYQTAISELTALPVSNASMYDAGTALAEAAFLAGAHTRRERLLVSAGVHPEYRQVLLTESAASGPRPQTLPLAADTLTDLEALKAALSEDVAAVVVQQPGFFGGLEDMAAVAAMSHEAGALFIAVVEPLSLGLLEPPGDYAADVAVGEGQCLGTPMSFGGPGLGFMAVAEPLMRRLPGRLVGETVDADGRRGFVLTLQTREQHIRRDRATSNICSNHALNALAALVYLCWLGRQGFPALAELCARKAAYLRRSLLAIPGVTPFTAGPVFREFALRLPRRAEEVAAALAPRGVLAGVPASRFAAQFAGRVAGGSGSADAGLDDVLLVAVTERRSRAQMDHFADALREVLGDE